MQQAKSDACSVYIYLVSYVEFVNEIQIDEHACRSTQSGVVTQWKVTELVVNKRQLPRFRYRQLLRKTQCISVHVLHSTDPAAGYTEFPVSSIAAAKTNVSTYCTYIHGRIAKLSWAGRLAASELEPGLLTWNFKFDNIFMSIHEHARRNKPCTLSFFYRGTVKIVGVMLCTK